MNWYKKAKKEKKCSGWIAVRLDRESSKKIQNWGKKQIPDEQLYYKKKEKGTPTDFGRELDTHITILYGVCANNIEVVETLLKDQKPLKAKLRQIGFFKSPDGYEPLIIKVESEDLNRLHFLIKETLCVQTSFDIYKPHCTIAYLKKGEAMKYAGDRTFDGINLTFDKIVFVNNDDIETFVNLKK